MRRLTESLLELARLEAGQASLANDRVDLAGLAQSCVDRILPIPQPREIRLHSDLHSAAAVGSP